jgi:hypothetical protein
MNHATTSYRRALSRHLHCGRAYRKRSFERFQTALDLYLEDCPDPTLQDLTGAFGTPEQLARTYLQDVPAAELKTYKTLRQALLGLVAALLCTLILWSIYRTFFRPEVVTVQQEVIIYDDVYEPDGEES